MPHPCGCQSKAHRDVLANRLTAKMEKELESLCLSVDMKNVRGT